MFSRYHTAAKLCSDGAHPLLAAVKTRDFPSVTEQLRAGVSPSTAGYMVKYDPPPHGSVSPVPVLYDSFPLFLAARNDDAEMCQLLLDAGAHVNQVDAVHPESALVAAARDNHVDAARVLLRHPDVDVNGAGDYHNCPLYYAVRAAEYGLSTELLQLFLKNLRLDVNRMFVDLEQCPLVYACVHDLPDVANLLLADSRIDVNSGLPLLTACEHGSDEMIDILLEDGRVNVHAALEDGLTALHFAVLRDDGGACAKRLMFHGADASATTTELQATAGQMLFSKYRQDKEVDAVALSLWFNWVNGWAPIRIGARLGNVDEMRRMLRKGMLSDELQTVEIMLALEESRQLEGKETTEFLKDVFGGWSRKMHWCYSEDVREAVKTILLVDNRLAAIAGESTPVLPTEMWSYMLQFVRRMWWN